jgi:hypothetical protein
VSLIATLSRTRTLRQKLVRDPHGLAIGQPLSKIGMFRERYRALIAADDKAGSGMGRCGNKRSDMKPRIAHL